MKIDVNENDFQEKVIEKSKEIPVLVDFWAPWCMPCLLLGPTLESLASRNEGKFILAKLNVDNNQLKAAEYGIMGIPAVKLFKNGEVVGEFVGVMPEEEVVKFLKEKGVDI